VSKLWSAQVVLRAPDAEAEDARRLFLSRGFDVGPVYAGSFPISAPPDVFIRTFGGSSEGQGWETEVGRSETTLPTGELPPEVRRIVSAVVFESPPDFGPTNP
jgi:hypothetical protein